MNRPAALPLSADDNLIQRLGHAGLVPFVLLAATVWLVEPELQPWAAIAMASYAALIVSFLGGIHWGLAFRQPAQAAQPPLRPHLGWGVVASLLAWPGVLMPPHAGLVWLALALIGCYAVDRRLYPAAGVGRWLTLRFRLSAVAALSCLLAAGAV
ncbi:DUF3429 domain-containing protein [Hydrogenophaga sp. OTU3427]|uniref:DUF3429 domain-containing protein n=1 Tax=Hydrogenophaga sp. OTU3427 TaxID=3043856 RepID=UPI00313BE95E